MSESRNQETASNGLDSSVFTIPSLISTRDSSLSPPTSSTPPSTLSQLSTPPVPEVPLPSEVPAALTMQGAPRPQPGPPLQAPLTPVLEGVPRAPPPPLIQGVPSAPPPPGLPGVPPPPPVPGGPPPPPPVPGMPGFGQEHLCLPMCEYVIHTCIGLPWRHGQHFLSYSYVSYKLLCYRQYKNGKLRCLFVT